MDKTAKAEMDRLHGDIITALYIDGGRPSDAAESAGAYDARDVVLLRLFWRFVSDRTINFHSIRHLYLTLNTQGVPDLEQQVTADRVRAFVSIWNEMIDFMSNNPESHANERMTFVVMADASDRVLAKRIMLERWPGSMEQARELLEEMRRSPKPLSAGSL